MIELLAPVVDLLQVAHDTQMPHQEPAKGASGGASTVVVLAGIAVTLLLVAGLVWLKQRADGDSTIHREG